MKKSGILLLASAALLLASCGTTYTLNGSDDSKLTLSGSSFSLYDGSNKLTSTLKGKAASTEKGKYVLTVTSETYQLKKGETLTAFEEGLLGVSWSSADIEKIVNGKKVTKSLDEEDYYTITVSVNDEEKTYSVVLF